MNRMLLLVIWIEGRGENRPVRCFHLSFHPSFHPAAPAKLVTCRQLAVAAWPPKDRREDGKRAVATPLFPGCCRPSAFRVQCGLVVLKGVATALFRCSVAECLGLTRVK